MLDNNHYSHCMDYFPYYLGCNNAIHKGVSGYYEDLPKRQWYRKQTSLLNFFLNTLWQWQIQIYCRVETNVIHVPLSYFYLWKFISLTDTPNAQSGRFKSAGWLTETVIATTDLPGFFFLNFGGSNSCVCITIGTQGTKPLGHQNCKWPPVLKLFDLHGSQGRRVS